MKLFLLKFFTWWSGQTFGTQLWTWRFGELVGQDVFEVFELALQFGNRLFEIQLMFHDVSSVDSGSPPGNEEFIHARTTPKWPVNGCQSA